MKVSELGEFGLIDLLAKMISTSQAQQPPNPRLLIGIGDDAAAWRIPDEIQLATVDSMVQGVHFTMDTMTWKELGWKAMAGNVSDIVAMAGVPEYALVALTLPEDTLVKNVTDLYQGFLDLAKAYGINIIGGNISRSSVVTIAITVLGSGREDVLLRRSTARPGDLIAVTGFPGNANAGFTLLTEKPDIPARQTLPFRRAFTNPVPRMVEAQALVKNGVITAIDISDGLVADLGHICEASRVGARVNVDKLPVDEDLRKIYGERALDFSLSGGESFELIFTGKRKAIKQTMNDCSIPITIIGEIIQENPGVVSLQDGKGNLFSTKQTGWRHF